MQTPPRLVSLLVAVLVPFGSLPLLAADLPEDIVGQSYSAGPGGKLVVRTDRGSIRLTGGKASAVEIEVVRRVTRGSGDKARELMEKHEVRFARDGDTIRVDAALKGADRWNWRGPHLEVEVRVSLPREFAVDAGTSGGSVEATGLEGDLELRTSGGSIHLEEVGGRVRARTAGGSVKAARVHGTVELVTSGGSITVAGAAGDRLKVQTSGGSLKLSGIGVPLDAQTSGGSISLETSSGPVTASTSGGSITAVFAGGLTERATLKSSAGSIQVTLPADAAFDLDASTSAGSVRSDFHATPPADGRRREDRSSLRGPANGGGPELKLRTSAGGIRIRKG